MKKLFLVSLICSMGVSTANAGWFSDLFKKEAEPQTLSEACNYDEITSICPEIALGQKTVTECLSENVKSLSRKCSKFVKKSIKDNKDLVFDGADSATSAVTEQTNTVKNMVADKKAEKDAAKQAVKDKKSEIKANAKAIKKEFKDTAKAVKTDAIETGKSVKEIVTE